MVDCRGNAYPDELVVVIRVGESGWCNARTSPTAKGEAGRPPPVYEEGAEAGSNEPGYPGWNPSASFMAAATTCAFTGASTAFTDLSIRVGRGPTEGTNGVFRTKVFSSSVVAACRGNCISWPSKVEI